MRFTSAAPHSCEHCERFTLNLGLDRHTVQFSCGAKEVLAADQAGCPLFHAFIESVRWKAEKARLDEGLANCCNLSFTIRYEKEDRVDPAALFLSVAWVSDDEAQNIEGLGATRLRLWASEESVASVDITSRPYELDYASSASVEFSRNCIRSCQRDHGECRRQAVDSTDQLEPELIDPNSIPSRLLQLIMKDSALHVKLIGRDLPSAIQKEAVSRQGFAVLSYCWGGDQPVKLTRNSIGRLGDGIPTSQLPKTLRDAAWLTNEIGLEYLWIDALCIMQDNIEDKIHEIPRMELYYGHSTVTICAASAAKYSEGFLLSREENPANYSIGPIQIRAKTATGASGYVQAVEEADSFNLKRPEEPIALRGWTLQESLLSRRILIFATRQLYFTCTVANASCGGFEPTLKPRVMTSYESRVVGVHTLSGLRIYPIREIWHTIVSEYTSRSLGVATDKLPAVSAMASSLPQMAKERNQKLVYLAGLMIDVSDTENYYWRTELLWIVTRMESARRVPECGPSWSWCSVDGPILPWSWSQPNDWRNTDKTQLCEYGVELESEVAPFGAVKGGFMKIYGRLKSLDSVSGVSYMISTRRDNKNERVDTDADLVLSPDTTEAAELVRKGIRGRERVSLLELMPFYENRTSPAGIIVSQIPSTGHSVRLGVFEFQKPVDKRAGAEIDAARTFFDDSSWEHVYLI
ncbi:HET-domain-containing protein [Hypoxylon sp. FL1857]|nr:HET-domain-containing protein [Hypoxylon sp. FL1857]